MQQQLRQCYNALTMVDEAKQHAISYLLINVFTPGMIQPQQIEIALPPSEGTAVNFTYDLEQDRELIERRYASENSCCMPLHGGPSHVENSDGGGKGVLLAVPPS